MPAVNPKNEPNALSVDLGISAGSVDLETEEEKKKKLLQQQQELMGRSGSSVYGNAAMSLLGAPSV